MSPDDDSRLRFLRRRTDAQRRRLRRGVYLLPSLFTMGNMFCGYACVVYAMRGEYEAAAPFIGFAFVLDMLDGRIARLTGGESDFGLQFDSLADVGSFWGAPPGRAPPRGAAGAAGSPVACSGPGRRCASRAATARAGEPTSAISSGCRARLPPR